MQNKLASKVSGQKSLPTNMFWDQLSPVAVLAIGLSCIIGVIPFRVVREKISGFATLIAIFVIMMIMWQTGHPIVGPLISALLLFAVVGRRGGCEERHSFYTEHLFFVTFVVLGGYQMSVAKNFLSLYVGLETQSIAIYIIIAMTNAKRNSMIEPAKYFMLNCWFSALVLFGLSWCYGAFGTLGFEEMSLKIPAMTTYSLRFALFGVSLLLMGIFFKLAIPPFHLWAQDVYESLTCTTAGIVMVSGATFGIIALNDVLRIFLPHPQCAIVGDLVFGAGLMGVLIGSTGLLANHSIKKFVSYGLIAQTGLAMIVASRGADILLLGLALHRGSIALFVIFGYMLSVVPILIFFGDVSGKNFLETVVRLAKTGPIVFGCVAISFLSLVGMPLSVGFVSKVFVVASLVEVSEPWVLCVAFSPMLVTVYVYCRIIKAIYLGGYGGSYDFGIVRPGKIVVVVAVFVSVLNFLAIFFIPSLIRLLQI